MGRSMVGMVTSGSFQISIQGRRACPWRGVALLAGRRVRAGCRAGGWQAGPPSGHGPLVGLVLGAVAPAQRGLFIAVDERDDGGGYGGGVAQQAWAAQ